VARFALVVTMLCACASVARAEADHVAVARGLL
jgi:hypothetical protein